MRKLIYGLLVVALVLVVVACAPMVMQNQVQTSTVEVEDVKLSVVTDTSPEIFDIFPFNEVSFGHEDWAGYTMPIDPPYVQGILWRPIDTGGTIKHMVLFGFVQNRSCVAFYDEGYESLVTAPLLSEAIATCYDMIVGARVAGMSQEGSDLDSEFIDRYSRQILLECGDETSSYNWFNQDAAQTCSLPFGYDSDGET